MLFSIFKVNTVEKMKKYLIIGQGAIGSQVSNELARNGLKVTGNARGKRNQYDLMDSVEYIQSDARKLVIDQLIDFTHIVIIVSPDRYCSEGYADSYLAVARHISKFNVVLTKLQRLVFISSTGVYGQSDGTWIDELTEPKIPTMEGAQIILQAETLLQQAYDKLIIIRPSGIYGQQRLMRIKKAQESLKQPISDNAWTNRIMDTDLVHIICQVLQTEQPKRVYLATDYQPVTSYELMVWLCRELNTQIPDSIEDSPITGKRVHSNIPLSWLKFPDWKKGYQDILSQLAHNKQ